jgi:hypothetical protein
MSKPKFDWPNAIIIAIAGALLVYALIVLGNSPLGAIFPSAGAQTVPPSEIRFPDDTISPHERTTYTLPLNRTHKICWGDPNPAGTVTSFKVWRYRVEGGARTLYLELPRASWVADPAGGFCRINISLPKAGHWIYDAALCTGTVCSTVVTASCSAGTVGCAGAVGGSARGWWIYGFLPAPTGVGVE